jgi:hypothetical protein
MKHASVIGHVAAVAVPSAVALTLGVDALVIGAALIGLTLIRRRPHLRGDVVDEAHACGSCGRSFPSNRELKQHQQAVHAPGLLSRTA